MNYRQIIQEAWDFAQNHKAIMLLYAFLPTILNAIFSFAFISYQFLSLKNSPAITHNEDSSFWLTIYNYAQKFISENPNLVLPIGAILCIYLLAYTFMPIISKGAIVQLSARIRHNQNPKLFSGLGYGLRSFLPMFGFNLFLNIFSLSTIFGYFMMVFRNFSIETTKLFIPVFILLFIVGIIMSFLFAFAENYIVIDDKSVDQSIWASSRLVLQHWTETIFVLILIGLIAVRMVLNLVILFLIPFLISLAISFFAAINVANLGIILTATIVLISIYIIGYVGGTFTVFANAVWTFAFLELTGDKNISARKKVA
jgi:hypothetical protein